MIFQNVGGLPSGPMLSWPYVHSWRVPAESLGLFQPSPVGSAHDCISSMPEPIGRLSSRAREKGAKRCDRWLPGEERGVGGVWACPEAGRRLRTDTRNSGDPGASVVRVVCAWLWNPLFFVFIRLCRYPRDPWAVWVLPGLRRRHSGQYPAPSIPVA